MPRETRKCREWEKERRNRLNDAFTTLSKLLPCYDPASNISKIDILKNASAHIEELQSKIKTLISENSDDSVKNVKSEEYKKLQDRIRKLLTKNEQLCALLREARITIPPGCGLVKKFKKRLFWSNRISPEQAKLLQKKEAEKENDASVKKQTKFTNKKQNKVGGQNCTPKHRKAILNRSDSRKIRPINKKNAKPLTPSKCVIVLSQPSISQPCYVITNAPSNNLVGGTSTVITNSDFVTNPLVSSKATKTLSSISTLGPGTLILANGTIVPVLPQQTVLPLAPQIITRPPIILLPKNPVSTSGTLSVSKITTSDSKHLSRIRPKYCLTKTTQVNKLPIPALTSRYSDVEIVLRKSQAKIIKEKKTVNNQVNEGEVPETGEKRKVPSPEETSEAKKAKISEENTDNVNQKKKTESEQEKTAVVETDSSSNNDKNDDKSSEDKTVEEIPPKTNDAEPKKPEEPIELNINHSELSNDLFASLQVPPGCQNPESTSPTAAFLLAFPLVSSLIGGVKVAEVTEDDNTESQRGTPTLLQIGTMDSTKPTQSDSLTPSLLNLDNFSFLSSKDIGGFYNSFEGSIVTTTASSVVNSESVVNEGNSKEVQKQDYHQHIQKHQSQQTSQETQLQQQSPQSQQLHQQQQKPLQQHPQQPIQQQQPLQPPQQSLQQSQQPSQQAQKPIQQSQQPLQPQKPLQQSQQPQLQPQQPVLQPQQPVQQSQQPLPQPQQTLLQQQPPLQQQKQPLQQQQQPIQQQKPQHQQPLQPPQQSLQQPLQQPKQLHQHQQQTHQQQSHQQQSQQPQQQQPPQPHQQQSQPSRQQQSQPSHQQQSQPSHQQQSQPSHQQQAQQSHQPQSQQPQSQQPQSLQQNQQHRQEKSQLVPCFDNHAFGTTNNQPLNYQPKINVGNLETKQQSVCGNTYVQKSFTYETPKVSATCVYANIKTYPEPLYTNSSTHTYSNTSDTNFNQNYYKEIPKSDNRSYYSLNYENYADYRKNDGNSYFPNANYYTNTNYAKDKFTNNNNNNNQNGKKGVQSRPPINWMTTPDNRLQTPADYVLPQFTKENDFYPINTFTNTQTTYFNTNPMYPTNSNEPANQEPRKSLDLSLVPPVNSYQRTEIEDNQLSWSPTKIPQFLDPPHSFASTLPTLVEDLVLGNPLSFNDQKDKCPKKDRRLKNYESTNQSNFLSVSQLVDHNKEVVPARTTARRNSGNRSSGKKVPQKSSQRKENKEVYPQPNKTEGNSGKGMKQLGYSNSTTDIFCDSSQKSRTVSKNSYSAEALIGHQLQNDTTQKKQQNYNNKPISVSSFLHDNIIPYFPVDLPQENTYIQQNQNYQTSSFSHNFQSTFQNNTYTANSFIPTTTITSSYNFMHDVTHDYSDLFPPMGKDKNCAKTSNRNVREQQCPTTPKKSSKRKHSNELPGFDFPFLSMPGSINSPILPDDFHTHSGFLQPPTPQLYPCKNPFTKPNDLASGSLLPLPPVPGTRSNIQHPEISPINSAGTSLTNFNLSTIFPEINNKGGLSDPYTENRIKDNPRSYTTSVQVSFNDKPTFSFSYINCTTSQSYNNQ